MIPKACFISRAVDAFDKGPHIDRVLKDLVRVSTQQNNILKAIMEVQHKWDTKPIVWVNELAYKIIIIKRNYNRVSMYQMSLHFEGNRYNIINKRVVEVHF